ncbi:BPSL0067 family protein [Nannocystis radixulma]|uniref:BPSL0067 family protein n=1 Tax=Nannocystis radixulma TaxID=2995305 RepID=A0ABT5B561_9BACT|nr:BPSL0067 family protein [Nannocystis radixulma]MDC0669253.1 BPSL0067 family protein [Nannocystis radixulma]
MPFVCTNYLNHVGKQKKDNGSCVRLVQLACAGVPNTSLWRPGKQVKGNDIAPGTVIATFNAEGRYPNLRRGNHAAFYHSQDRHTLTVVDQYVGARSIRKSNYKFDNPGGSLTANADTYYVVETEASLRSGS